MANSFFKIECSIIEGDWYKKYFDDNKDKIPTYRIKFMAAGHKEERKKIVTCYFDYVMDAYTMGIAFAEWKYK